MDQEEAKVWLQQCKVVAEFNNDGARTFPKSIKGLCEVSIDGEDSLYCFVELDKHILKVYERK